MHVKEEKKFIQAVEGKTERTRSLGRPRRRMIKILKCILKIEWEGAI